MTPEEFERIISEKGGTGNPFFRLDHRVQITCHLGHEFETTPRSIQKGAWCSVCNGYSRKLSQEKFLKRVSELGGIVCGPYATSKILVRVSCSEGHTFFIRPDNVKRGQWCSRCARNSPTASREKFEQIVREKKGKILSPYLGNRKKVYLECSEGHQFEKSPVSVKMGRWCRQCK